MFIVELMTRDGRVCERYPTYEEARQRVDRFPAESLLGIPFIFQELADSSQRLVREQDGKPLQWHRIEEDPPPGSNEPLPLGNELPRPLGPDGHPVPLVRPIELPREEPDQEEPLPLSDGKVP